MNTSANWTFDKTDVSMVLWAQTVLGDVSVSLELPPVKGSSVSAYLMDVLLEPLTRSAREPEPHRLTLGYLVTTWADSPSEAHRLLGELLFEALDNPEMVVEAKPLPPALWQALGQTPRPAFILRVPSLKPRSALKFPKVRSTSVTMSSLHPLVGQVRGPGDTGISEVLVEVPALNLSTRTDASGAFYFPSVPAQPPARLNVHVKGRKFEIAPADFEARKRPLIIQLTEEQL